MSATASEGAPRWQAVLFTAIPAFGIMAAIALMVFGGSLQPLGSPQAASPAISTSAPEEPSEPTGEEPAPAADPEPSTEPTPEPEEPKEPVDLGAPTTELGLALVSEFGEGTTFWRDSEQVRDPEQGDRLRAEYRSDVALDQLISFWVGTDAYWLRVISNSEADGLEVEIKE